MVKFEKVSDDEIVATERQQQGTVSFPILKAFMESNLYIAKMEEEFEGELKRDAQGLSMTLRNYAKKHQMPVSVIVRNNSIYLMRLDIKKDGTEVPDWKKKIFGPKEDAKTINEDQI